jgi:hypothetical protein
MLFLIVRNMSNKDEESKNNGKKCRKYTFPTRGYENFAVRAKGD